LLSHHPFRPFRLFTVDGQSYEIRHGEPAACDRSFFYLAVVDPGQPDRFRSVLLNMLPISRIEFDDTLMTPIGF
jgi:hypothetical protein